MRENEFDYDINGLKDNCNANEMALFSDNESVDSFDFDDLEERLQSQLDEELSELDFLETEKEKIGSLDNLGETIKNVVWEQFVNQIATTAGEDFIKENNGLTLDLRKEAHIQTTENFEKGKIATHNTEIDYQERHDEWQSNFKKDKSGKVITKTDNRTGKEKEVLVKGARAPFDKDRPKGSATIDMDHTVAAAEIIRDPAANAHMTKEEQINFANSEKNLNPLDSSANRSKGDSTTEEWLNSERDGQKPAERFNINEEELMEQDRVAREEYEKLKAEGEKRSIDAGKKSQKEEAKRIGGKAVRAVVMRLLAEFVKEVIAKLVKWFKSAGKKLETLLSSLKEAISSFVSKLKTHLLNAADTLITTIATAIIGPVIGTIKKVWTLLKQGWKSLKEAIAYIKSPESKGKPISLLILEVGKIVMAGLSAVGAIVLGEVIEKGLMAIPILAIEIPLIGSLANILGIFLGAVVAGIIGAIAINLIQKAIEKKKKSDAQAAIIEKSNQIIAKQHQIQIVSEALLERDKENTQSNISGRHQEAASIMKDAYGNIMEDFVDDFSEDVNTLVIDEEDVITNQDIDKTSKDLDNLLAGLN